MAAKIQKKYSISAKGILHIDENNNIFVENEESGALTNVADLFVDFNVKSVSLSINYNEDCE